VFPTVPPRVEYELTELGSDLLVPVKALAEWAVINRERLNSARRHFDAHGTSKGEPRPREAAKAVAPQGS
jgi:DNA-binding HxlR family transcriptional regulator